jgi:hypothetical protein
LTGHRLCPAPNTFCEKHEDFPMPKASAALDAFIDETIRIAREHGYHPTAFIEMRQRHGTMDAIARLVESGDVQSGFKRLQQLGLLDYSIETAVLKFPTEFTKASRDCAEFRLRVARES